MERGMVGPDEMGADAARRPARDAHRPPGSVTLVGSGEMAASMAKVHREVMSRIDGPVRAVFLDTPAGFELNADEISARAVEYFRRRLDLDLEIASFKAAATATPQIVGSAVRKLRRANYVFAGPGSPTYAVRNWQGTPVLEALASRLRSGAHLVLASAAAIAVGRYALPVYEIYKVGEEPRWADGVDLLAPYGFDLAIVPHWNNAEGGTHDTRYCFVGAPRFAVLEGQLPASTAILGVDEYTACVVDLGRGECQVLGAGGVTLRHGGREWAHPSGTVFDLEELRGPNTSAPVLAGAVEGAEAVPVGPPDDLAWSEPVPEEDQAPLIDLLVSVRDQLRAARQWQLADEIRRRLSDLGVILEDGESGTTWRRA